MSEKEYIHTSPELEEVLEQSTSEDKHLILHNDEVHTFDFVIENLIKICKMDAIQAEQCTFLVHYKGKCDVKKGTLEYLKPFKEALTDKGLEATID
jgi:ATP-dependent Clp protease adaptor protein ClpS